AGHRQPDDDERETADRQVDVEDPAPGRVVDDQPADRRADDRGGREGRADQALVAAAVARRDDVADRGDRERDQAARANALDPAEDGEHPADREPVTGRRAGQALAQRAHPSTIPPDLRLLRPAGHRLAPSGPDTADQDAEPDADAADDLQRTQALREEDDGEEDGDE